MRRRAVNAILLVAVLFLQIVPASHVEPEDEVPSLEEAASDVGVPSTGIGFLDSLAEDARDDALSFLAEVDGILAEAIGSAVPDVPHQPSPAFREDVGTDGRLGGLDEWYSFGPGNVWKNTSTASSSGSWSFASVDEAGEYPEKAEAYLVSPRLDLRPYGHIRPPADLEVQIRDAFERLRELGDREFGGGGGEPPLGGEDGEYVQTLNNLESCVFTVLSASNGRGTVTLRFDHRFSLAAFGGGEDFGRAWVYYERPEPGRADQQIRHPLPLTTFALANEADSFADCLAGAQLGFSGSSAVTGGQAQWSQVESDLSRHAGLNVWLAFELETKDRSQFQAPTWFQSEHRFPVRDFFGWWIDNISVDAVALPDYVRIVDFTRPDRVEDGAIVVAPKLTQPVSFRVHNAGAREATFGTEVRVTPTSGPQQRLPGPEVTLTPGDVETVHVPWAVPSQADPDHPRPYSIQALLTGLPSTNRADSDTGTGEDRRVLDVEAVRIVRPAMTVTPAEQLADRNVERHVDVRIDNFGNVPVVGGVVQAEIVEIRTNKSLTPDGPLIGNLSDVAPGKAQTVPFSFTPSEAGVYRFTAGLHDAEGKVLVTRSGLVGVRTSAAIMFLDDHSGPNSKTGFGYEEELPEPIAEAVGSAENDWMTADPFLREGGHVWRFDEPSAGLGPDSKRHYLRGMRVSPDPTQPDVPSPTLEALESLFLDYDVHVRQPVLAPSIPVDIHLAGAASVRDRTEVPGPLITTYPVEIANIPRDVYDIDWNHRRIDVLQALRAAGAFGVSLEPAFANGTSIVGLSFGESGPFAFPVAAYSNITLVATLTTGENIVLLRTNGNASADVGHWEGWTPPVPEEHREQKPDPTRPITWVDTGDLHVGTDPTTDDERAWWRTDQYESSEDDVWQTMKLPGTADRHVLYHGEESNLSYPKDLLQRVVSPVIDLSSAPEPFLELQHKWSFAGGNPNFAKRDFGRLGVQIWDAQNATFQPISWIGDKPFVGSSQGMPENCGDAASVGTAPFTVAEIDLRSAPVYQFERAGGGIRTTDGNGNPLTVELAGEVVRFVFDAYTGSGFLDRSGTYSGPTSCGWFVGPIRVDGSEQFASDLKLDRVWFPPEDVPYDPFEIGIGANTTVPVNVTITNAGLFEHNSYAVYVNLTTDEQGQNVAAQAVHVENTNPLAAQETLTVTVNLTTASGGAPLPTGPYYLHAAVEPVGEFEDFPVDNRCFVLAKEVCEHDDFPATIAVTRHVDLAIRALVEPASGSVEQQRFIRAVIANQGNVPVLPGPGFEVSRLIQPLDGSGVADPTGGGTWSVPVTLAVGEERLIETLIPEYREEMRWKPTSSVDHLLVMTVNAGTVDADVPDNTDQVVMEITSTFFLDGLEGERHLHEGFTSGEWELGPSWNEVVGSGFSSPRSWRAGTGTPITIPTESNTSLALPTVDISSASSASLSFVHQYQLEEGFDGGIVEASVDGGPWQVIQPNPRTVERDGRIVTERYPGTVVSSNPTVPGNDPRAPSDAYTGGAGWQVAEFNLGQVDELTENEAFAALTAQSDYCEPPVVVECAPYDFSQADLTSPDDDPPSAFFREAWGWQRNTAGNTTQAGWFIQDVRALEPANASQAVGDPNPPPAQDSFLFVTGAADSRANHTINLPDLAAGERVLLSYLQWDRDHGGVQAVQVREAGQADWSTVFTAPVAAPTTRADWTLMRADLTQFANQTINVAFHYKAPGGLRIADGWAIDDILVETVSSNGVPLSTILEHDFETGPEGAWTLGDGFAIVERVPVPNPGPWHVADLGGGEFAWRFGSPGDETYPARSEGRLVTPSVDLTRIGGTDASLRLDHRYDFETRQHDRFQLDRPVAVDGAVVEVQVLDPVTKSWGPWRQLYSTGTASVPFDEPLGGYPFEGRIDAGFPFEQHEGPTYLNPANKNQELCGGGFETEGERLCRAVYVFSGNSPASPTDWTTSTFDLSEFVGRQVRFGFHGFTNPTDNREGWLIGQASIAGSIFVGKPVDLRLRLGTDGGVTNGFWQVDNVSVAGKVYGKNLGIFLEDPSPERLTEPGHVATLEATMQNLGSEKRSNIHFVVEELDGASLRFRADPEDPWSDRIVIGPLFPGASGTLGDRLDFRIDVDVPPTEDQVYRVAFSLRTGEELLPISDEQVIGNLQREVVLDTRPPTDPVVLSGFRATPNVVSTGDLVALEADVRNVDVRDRSVAVEVFDEGGSVLSDASFVLPAGSSCGPDDCTWQWTAAGPGFHRFVVRVTPQGHVPIERTVDVAVDDTFLYFFSAFENATERVLSPGAGWWFAATPASHSPNGVQETYDPVAFPFAFDDGEGRDKGYAVLAGVSRDLWKNETSYPAQADGYAMTPPIDLTDVPTWQGRLTFWHSPRFTEVKERAPGFQDGAVVEVCRLNADDECKDTVDYPRSEGWVRLYPGPDGPTPYTHVGPTADDQRGAFGQGSHAFHPLGPWTEPECPMGGCTSAEAGIPYLSGQNAGFDRVVIDLADQRKPTKTPVGLAHAANMYFNANGDPVDILGERVRFRFRVASWDLAADWETAAGQGWLLDDVAVSAYEASVVPDVQRFALREDTEKRFNIVIINSGAGTDTFDVRLAPETALPEGFAVTLPEPVVLHPDEYKVVSVIVTAPITADGQPSTQAVEVLLDIVPLTDPSQFAQSRLTFDFETSTWPDLHIRDAALVQQASAGQPVDLFVTIDNLGTRPAPPAVVRLLATPPGSDDAEVVAETTTGQTVDAVTGFVTVPLKWTPEPGVVGTYELRVEVNPDGAFSELSPNGNVHILQAPVALLERPDLVVANLTLLNASSLEPARLAHGEMVRVHAVVANDGTGRAEDATVEILIDGFVARTVLVPALDVGQEVVVATNWPATEGLHSIQVSAKTRPGQGDWNASDNHAVVDADVHRSDVFAAFPPLALQLSTAASLEIPVANHGSLSHHLRLNVSAPLGWRVTTSPPEIILGPGEQAHFELRIEPPEDPPSGDHVIRAELVEPGNPDPLAAHSFIVQTAGRLSLRLETSYVTGSGEDAGHVIATVRNPGTAALDLDVRLEVPPGWPGTPRQTIHVPPGETVVADLPVEPAPTTRAGTHTLRVVAETACCLLAEHWVEVVVPARPVWRVETLRQEATDTGLLLTLRVTNAGNAAGETPLRVDGVPGPWQATLSDPHVHLAPGATRLVTLRIDGPAGETFEGAALDVSAAGAESTGVAHVKPLEQGLAVKNLNRAGETAPRDGEVVVYRVDLTGVPTGQTVLVAFYVDDTLVDAKASTAGDTTGKAHAEFPWLAKGGRHLLSAHVDPQGHVRDPDRGDNLVVVDVVVLGAEDEGGPLGMPVPGFGGFFAAVAACLAAWFVRQRRRRVLPTGSDG